MDSSSPPRKRGAPPGNLNALRHGAYAHRTPLAQDDQPDSAQSSIRRRLSLAGEIDYLRAYFYRLAISSAVQSEPEQIAATLRTLSVAAAAISRLVQIEGWLARASGTQIQYDQLHKATAEIQSAADLLLSNKNASSDLLLDASAVESLMPGIQLIARQLGLPVSDLTPGLALSTRPDTPSPPQDPVPQ